MAEKVSSNQSFGGAITKFKAKSASLGGLETNFNVFVPSTSSSGPFPVLYYLAGLTCTEDTGAQKGGFLRDAAEHGIALVFPDTSPRGAKIEGEDDSWDFGTGAGFYIDATADKWSKYYNMESFVTKELPSLLSKTGLPLDLKRTSVFGHSMVRWAAKCPLSTMLTHPSTGRPRRALALPEVPGSLPVRVSLCAHLRADGLPVG
jgi:S-formylglutathione hydrolase